MIILAIALVQSSIASGGEPGLGDAKMNAVMQRTRQMLAHSRYPSSNIQNPIKPTRPDDVDENAVVAAQIALANDRKRRGLPDSTMSLAAEPYSGCRKAVTSPMGVKVLNANNLNGITATYRCQGFSAVVSYMDLSLPVSGGISAGHPESATVAIINGGSVSRTYVALPNTGARVTNSWTGKKRVLSVSVVSSSLPLGDLQRKCDLMTETLTKQYS